MMSQAQVSGPVVDMDRLAGEIGTDPEEMQAEGAQLVERIVSAVEEIEETTSKKSGKGKAKDDQPKPKRRVKADLIDEVLKREQELRPGILEDVPTMERRVRELKKMTMVELDKYIESLHSSGLAAVTLKTDAERRAVQPMARLTTPKKEPEPVKPPVLDDPRLQQIMKEDKKQAAQAIQDTTPATDDSESDSEANSDPLIEKFHIQINTDDEGRKFYMLDGKKTFITDANAAKLCQGLEGISYGMESLCSAFLPSVDLTGYYRATVASRPELMESAKVLFENDSAAAAPLRYITNEYPLAAICFTMMMNATIIALANKSGVKPDQPGQAGPARREPRFAE